MKFYTLLAITALTLFMIFTSELMDDNGRAGATGSPGETTCNTTQCHNSYALNSGGGSISATCNMINWKYEPLTTYTISIKVVKAGVGLFGFGVEILTAANNNAGTIIVTDAVHTQIKTRTISGVSRRNIVHKLNGGISQDSVTFTFNWTSPDTTTGPITMYFAGNATNSGGNVGGDYIYTSSQLITPSSGNGIKEFVSVDPFSVFPNPASGNVYLHYNLLKSEVVEVKLFDINSSLSYLLQKKVQPAGENNEMIPLPAECRSGLYLLTFESISGRSTKKLIIN